MATLSWSTPADHTTTAGFRAWGSELSAKLQAAGLVQTADTGQINWTTVNLPATNTPGGYEIYRFNDALNATKPIYIKIEYGTGNGTGRPCIWITAGTGTNGAGTLSGASNRQTAYFANIADNTGSLDSYLCVKDGFVGLGWKYGLCTAQSNNRFYFFFAVARTVDDTGAETGDGFFVLRRQAGVTAAGGTVVESVSYADGVQASQNGYYAMVPANVSSSAVGADKQVYKCYGILPRVRPIMQAAVVLNTEYPVGVTFTAALVGTTARTYLSLGDGANYAAVNRNAAYSDAILWE